MRIIAAVFGWHACAKVDENEIPEIHFSLTSCSPIDVGQCLIESWRLFACILDFLYGTKNFQSTFCQWDGTIAIDSFRRSRPPLLSFIPELQCLIDGKCLFIPINTIPCQTNQFAGAKSSLENQSVLIIVIGLPRGGQKCILFFDRQKLNIIGSPDRLCKPNTSMTVSWGLCFMFSL